MPDDVCGGRLGESYLVDTWRFQPGTGLTLLEAM